MTRAIIIALVILTSTFSKAQDYIHAAGYRAGLSNGLQYQVFTNEVKAYELLLSFRYEGVQLTALSKSYTPASIGDSERFFWYYGFGAHIGYHNTSHCFDCHINDSLQTSPRTPTPRDHKNNMFALGVDFVGGLEYRLMTLPFTLGIDWKPYIGFFGPRRIARNIGDFAITARYTFK